MPDDLQTVQGKEDAEAAPVARAADEAKREAIDDDVDTEISMSALERDVEDSNRKGDDKVLAKKKVKRSETNSETSGGGTDEK